MDNNINNKAYGYHCTQLSIDKDHLLSNSSVFIKVLNLILHFTTDKHKLAICAKRSVQEKEVKHKLAHLVKFLSIASRQNVAVRNALLINKQTVASYIINVILQLNVREYNIDFIQMIEGFAQGLINLAKIRNEVGIRVKEIFSFGHTAVATHVKSFITEKLQLSLSDIKLKSNDIANVLNMEINYIVITNDLKRLISYFGVVNRYYIGQNSSFISNNSRVSFD